MDLFLLKSTRTDAGRNWTQTQKQGVSSRVDETNQLIVASQSQWEDFRDVILWPLTSSLPTQFRLWQLYRGGFTPIWPGCFMEELVTGLAVTSSQVESLQWEVTKSRVASWMPAGGITVHTTPKQADRALSPFYLCCFFPPHQNFTIGEEFKAKKNLCLSVDSHSHAPPIY